MAATNTLKQIIDGVVGTKYAKEKNAVVVPFHKVNKEIDFDVAVTVVEGKETEGKAGISVWSIGAGVSGKSESLNSTVSRIKKETLRESKF